MSGDVQDQYEAVCTLVRDPEVIKAAVDAKVVWGKVGRYPFWPVCTLTWLKHLRNKT